MKRGKFITIDGVECAGKSTQIAFIYDYLHRKGIDVVKILVSIKGPADPENWKREKDVLDTWVSSWLWSFAVHSWPDKDKNLKTFYPTNT